MKADEKAGSDFYTHPGSRLLNFSGDPALIGLVTAHVFPKRMTVRVGESVSLGNPVYATDHFGRRVDAIGAPHPSQNLKIRKFHSLATNSAAGITLQNHPDHIMIIKGLEIGHTTFRFFPLLDALLEVGHVAAACLRGSRSFCRWITFPNTISKYTASERNGHVGSVITMRIGIGARIAPGTLPHHLACGSALGG